MESYYNILANYDQISVINNNNRASQDSLTVIFLGIDKLSSQQFIKLKKQRRILMNVLKTLVNNSLKKNYEKRKKNN